MKPFTLKDILSCTKSELLSQIKFEFSGVGFDTRSDLKDKIFIAIKGDKHDAHNFLKDAVKKGAAALVLHQETEDLIELKAGVTIIKVPDTLIALHDLARFSRRRSSSLVVGIAGSNGKTTSKELCASIIGAHRRIHYSKGSFNNHWGVPFTILEEPEQNEIMLLEMGMNHSGELAVLAKIAEPDIVIVTYVGVEHIEHFGTIEKIAEAEEEIYLNSPEKTQRIFNLDNSWTLKMFDRAFKDYPQAHRLWTFSAHKKSADVHLEIVDLTMNSLKVRGHIGGVADEVAVPIFGSHNLTNLMAASTVGLAVGLSGQQIWSSLPNCKGVWGRNQLMQTKGGAQILFDGYNANPDSMKALIENMRILKTSGRRIGIFGQMRELGSYSYQAHLELGHWMGETSFDLIWFVGEDHQSFEKGIKDSKFTKDFIASSDYDPKIANRIVSQIKADDIVFVKGSRGVELERFVLACDPIDFKPNKT